VKTIAFSRWLRRLNFSIRLFFERHASLLTFTFNVNIPRKQTKGVVFEKKIRNGYWLTTAKAHLRVFEKLRSGAKITARISMTYRPEPFVPLNGLLQ
jgi:hypothetical protein